MNFLVGIFFVSFCGILKIYKLFKKWEEIEKNDKWEIVKKYIYVCVIYKSVKIKLGENFIIYLMYVYVDIEDGL